MKPPAPRNNYFFMRLTDEEKGKLIRWAKKAKVSQSAFARWALFEQGDRK